MKGYFNIGDEIVGTNNIYGVTNTNMYKGVILDISECNNRMLIKVIDHKDVFNNNSLHWVNIDNSAFKVIHVTDEKNNEISNQDIVNYIKWKYNSMKNINKLIDKLQNEDIYDIVKSELQYLIKKENVYIDINNNYNVNIIVRLLTDALFQYLV